MLLKREGRRRPGVKVVGSILLLVTISAMLGGCAWLFNKPPVAECSATPTSGEAPLEVTFDASESYDPNGDTITYEWDFGDGKGAEGETVQHGFGSAGSYTVRLLVTDSKGKSDTSSVSISISQPPDENTKDHTFEAQSGTEYDTGTGLKVFVPPAPTGGKIKLVVTENPTPQQPEGDFIELHSVYDVSLLQESSPQEMAPRNTLQDSTLVTLTFEIPPGVDPRSAMILYWTDKGWTLAENEMGLPGGSVSADGRCVSVARKRLSSFSLASIGETVLHALDSIPEPPPKPPEAKILSTERDNSGDWIVTVELFSPYYWRTLGGMHYCIDVESSDTINIDTNGKYLSPGIKHNVVIGFPPEGGDATIVLRKGMCPLPRAALDWADRLGVDKDHVISVFNLLVESYERNPEGAWEFRDLFWLAKELLIKGLWHLAGSKVKFFANLVPVSVDMGMHIAASWFYVGSNFQPLSDPSFPINIEEEKFASTSALFPPEDVTLPTSQAKKTQTLQFEYEVELKDYDYFFTAIITPGAGTYHREFRPLFDQSGRYAGELEYTAPSVGETKSFEIQGQMCPTSEGESNSDSETVNFTATTVASGKYEIQWSKAESNGWANPLGEGRELITSTVYDYDSPKYIDNHNARHTGIDIHDKEGSPIHAIGDGIVERINIGDMPRNNVIIIKHFNSENQPFFAIYGHVLAALPSFPGSTASPGEVIKTLTPTFQWEPGVLETKVVKGQKVGTVVKCGTPSHLHFGINTSSKIGDFMFGRWGWGTVPEKTKGTDLSEWGWVDPIEYLNTYRFSQSPPIPENIPDTVYYGLYIRDIKADTLVFNSQKSDIKITRSSYQLPPGKLEWGRDYRWNMDAHHSLGWEEAYSKPLYFQTVVPAVNRRPTVSGANQYKSNGVTAIPERGTTPESTVVFKGTVSDPDGHRVKLEIELRQITEAFIGTPTWESSLVASGTRVSWTRGGLVNASYKWRYRAVDEPGLASSWVELGTAGNTDFVVAVPAEEVNGQITNYNPPNDIQVRIGEPVNLSCTILNTGNVRYTFIVGLSIWETGTNIYDTDIIDTQREVALDPGEQRTVASWTHTFTTSQAGEWYYQFGLWEARPFVSANLLDKKPSPAKIITVAKFRIGDRVRVTTNLNVRACADTSCSEISDPDYPGVAPTGTLGTVHDGPVSADGYVWWRVQYDPGFTGWSVENGLERI